MNEIIKTRKAGKIYFRTIITMPTVDAFKLAVSPYIKHRKIYLVSGNTLNFLAGRPIERSYLELRTFNVVYRVYIDL